MTDPLASQLADSLDDTFPDLVDVHGSMVLTLAIRLTDGSTGEDIAQDAFLRAYRALASYDQTQITRLDLRPWLATITRNLVKNEYRRRDRRPHVELDQRTQLVAPVDEAIDIIDTRDEVNDMLAALPDDQRDAVVLRHILGLPIREVALTLSCPVGTAKSHVSRGLGRLRDTHGDEANRIAEPNGGEAT